jgi:hypothetical protein
MTCGSGYGFWSRPRMLENKGETTNLSGDSTIVGLTPGTLFRWIESSLRRQRQAAIK